MPMDVKFMRQALSAIYYGDLLMTLRAQTEPYELEKGAAERLPKQMAGPFFATVSAMAAATPAGKCGAPCRKLRLSLRQFPSSGFQK